jgi:hypothetical protein
MLDDTYFGNRQDGVRGLYSGVGAVVIGAIPGHAIHFATYEAVKDKLGGSHTSSGQGNSDFRHAAAGQNTSHVRVCGLMATVCALM